MIIKTRRKNESILRRLINRASASARPPMASVLPQDMFEAELIKEAFRSNRRKSDQEFALITFDFSDLQATDRKLAALIAGFRSRLRVSDAVGWFDLQLAVLLPETKKEGALLVANQLAAISFDLGIKSDTHVAIYPWDDRLVQVTESLVAESDLLGEVQSKSHDQDDDFPNGGSFNSDSDFAPAAEAFQRTDSPHRSSHLFKAGQKFENDLGVLVHPASTSFLSSEQANASVQPAVHGTGTPLQVLNDKTPRWKRGLDIVGSGTGLLLLSPIFLVAAVAIKCSSQGPVFFIQKREGKDGREFGILKFRTMKVNAEAEQELLRSQSEQDGPAFKLKNDPRITFVGKYLRKSCIDELPQLYNVLMGEMSLVGPRPLPVGESQQCSPWQRQRLSILPGLTCIWQAHGGRDIKFSEWMRMDLEYIRKRSLYYDLKLILETAFLAILHRGSV